MVQSCIAAPAELAKFTTAGWTLVETHGNQYQASVAAAAVLTHLLLICSYVLHADVCDGVPRPTRPGQAQAGYFPSNCSREVGSTCEAICRQG
jgi:hypothetical protein